MQVAKAGSWLLKRTAQYLRSVGLDHDFRNPLDRAPAQIMDKSDRTGL